MNAVECIKTRRSIRRFRKESVSEMDLAQVVALAAYAPSWKNSQTVRYLAVMGGEEKKKVLAAMEGFEHNRGIIENAPALVVLLTEKGVAGCEKDGRFTTSKGNHWESFDAGVAAQTFCLAAHELGLGTLIMGMYEESRLRAALEIPEKMGISALIAVGYADESPDVRPRLSVEQLLTFR